MASRKLVRDAFLSKNSVFLRLTSQQGLSSRLGLPYANNYSGNRSFGVFSEFSKTVKGEGHRHEELQKLFKELKEKAEKFRGVADELKVRTKQKTEKLYEQADGVWTEAEATAKKVSANVKEKILAAKEEVKEYLGMGKQGSTESTSSSANDGVHAKNDFSDAKDGRASCGEGAKEQPGTDHTSGTLFGKFKSSIPSLTFQKLKEAKVTDFVKRGYSIVRDEITGKPTTTRKHLEYTPPSFKGTISTKTDIVVMPSKQSTWSKKWEAFGQKMQGHPLFKRVSGISEPVISKSQEIVEDMQERWDTSDNPIIHKLQDVSETVFQETDAAASYKEIRRRDLSFSLPDFVAEVQEAVRPVLDAYMKADLQTLKKYCSPEVITRCEAEHKAFQSHGIFFDNKILHISELEVRETKMMGTSPIIIVAFQTQQVHCVRHRNGAITEGGKDTIHTVYYAWAMQQVEPEEVGAIYPIWRLREMQQLGVQALI